VITAVLPVREQGRFAKDGESFRCSPLISRIFLLQRGGEAALPAEEIRSKSAILEIDAATSGGTVNRVLEEARTPYLLWVPPGGSALLFPGALERFADAAVSTGAGMVYGDYAGHPVNDCQLGSIRDTFDFGPVLFFNIPLLRRCLRKYGVIPDVSYAGLYDLRLKVSTDHQLFRVAEPLAAKMPPEDLAPSPGEAHFAYVDPRQRSYQLEMEQAATTHLKRLGACLAPDFRELPLSSEPFPVEASVIIPVRNRVRTVAEAVESAISQVTDFHFNILVVDNYSTDGTTEILKQLSASHHAVKHIVPARRDLGIGGCWNEAIQSSWCGRYAVQLDSDDLYSRGDALRQLVDALRQKDTAMVIGSYTLVNENLAEIPPGRIDHREWTDDNGRNNALRINGLGAPRAFRTSLVRRFGFPDVSYGEDYALALRICREYRIGRIYESLYFCRRWTDNTDAALSVETANRYDAYKDKLRTMEILARQKMNRGKGQNKAVKGVS